MARTLVAFMLVVFLEAVGNCQAPPGYAGGGNGGGLGPIPPTTVTFVPTMVPRIADGTLDMQSPNSADCFTRSMSALAVDSRAQPFLDFKQIDDTTNKFTVLQVVKASAGLARASSECFAQLGPSGLSPTGNFGVNVNVYSKGSHHSQRIQQNQTGESWFTRRYIVRLAPNATFGVLVCKLKADVTATGLLTGGATATVTNTNLARNAGATVTVNPLSRMFENISSSVGYQANAPLTSPTNRIDRLNAGQVSNLNTSYILVGDGDIIDITSDTTIEWNPGGQTPADPNGFQDGAVLSKGFLDVKVMSFQVGNTTAPSLGFPLQGSSTP